MNQYRRKIDTRKEFMEYLEENLKRPDEVVIFVTGGANTHESVGYYEYAAFNSTWNTVKRGEISNIKSANRSMLTGILKAVEEINLPNITTYTVVVSISLGFKRGKKGSGVNADLIQSILNNVSSKQCTFNVIECTGCAVFIKEIISRRAEKIEGFGSSSFNVKAPKQAKTAKQSKKTKYYAIRSIDGKVCNQILFSWDECKALVTNHKASFKSFRTLAEAEQYLGFDAVQASKSNESVTKLEFSIPESLYKKFKNKLAIMGYTKEMVLLDLVSDWCSYDE